MGSRRTSVLRGVCLALGTVVGSASAGAADDAPDDRGQVETRLPAPKPRSIAIAAPVGPALDSVPLPETGAALALDLGEEVPPKVRLMVSEEAGLSIVTGPVGEPAPDAAVLPRSDRLARAEMNRFQDSEIGLSIALSKGLDLVPSYGLEWSGDPIDGFDTEISHRFSIGARFGF